MLVVDMDRGAEGRDHEADVVALMRLNRTEAARRRRPLTHSREGLLNRWRSSYPNPLHRALQDTLNLVEPLVQAVDRGIWGSPASSSAPARCGPGRRRGGSTRNSPSTAPGSVRRPPTSWPTCARPWPGRRARCPRTRRGVSGNATTCRDPANGMTGRYSPGVGVRSPVAPLRGPRPRSAAHAGRSARRTGRLPYPGRWIGGFRGRSLTCGRPVLLPRGPIAWGGEGRTAVITEGRAPARDPAICRSPNTAHRRPAHRRPRRHDGTIDWYCCPRFDAPSVFASILDADRGGSFELAADVPSRTKQFYFPDTAS